ncbi:MAG: PAS domain-containing protein [Acidimicrobiia bacterium]|nr:PAS domain-containing protein [Acidimicrobiia bacterium]NNC42862.1 hypothetical protein [Acidimicrobiia bacterium]NNL27627.1 hypothetical protein [Acidimicrobiia bacterium]
MAQQPIELILLKQWATYIAIPLWIMDEAGNLVFYNEPAESVLGERFDEAGRINAEDLADKFQTRGIDGEPLESKELPIMVALTEGHPAHLALQIRSVDGEWREIQVSAIPIEGEGGRHLGAFAMFWETSQP